MVAVDREADIGACRLDERLLHDHLEWLELRRLGPQAKVERQQPPDSERSVILGQPGEAFPTGLDVVLARQQAIQPVDP